jgi:CheY-like chemotaxis protein
MTDKLAEGRRVALLAEDDREMRLLLSLTFHRNGWNVIECMDGIELMARLAPLLEGENAAVCDLIITDIRMPGMTGMEVVEKLARIQGCPPVIMITAFGNAETHELARQLGVAAILDKPFEIEDLIKTADDLTKSQE